MQKSRLKKLIFLLSFIFLTSCSYKNAYYKNNNKIEKVPETNDEFNKALKDYYETISSIDDSITNIEDTYFFNPQKQFNGGLKEEDSIDMRQNLYDASLVEVEIVKMDSKLKYATYSVIQTGEAKLYKYKNADRKTVCVNAGHGTPNGSAYNTFTHPDFSPKVTGGTTKEGSVLSLAVSNGTIFNDGKKESEMNLLVAVMLRDLLLKNGYNVLMIREDENCYLDNVARTVLANKYSDIHVSIHFDSTDSDKGFFYIGPANVPQYVDMEPVKSNVNKHRKLGAKILAAFRKNNFKIFNTGFMGMDLTQISYSTIASVDLELGDRATNLSAEFLTSCAMTIMEGIDEYFKS